MRLSSLLAMLSCFLPLGTAIAQGGGNAGGEWGQIAYAYLYTSSGEGRAAVHSLHGVVLWARSDAASEPTPEATAAARRLYRELQARAEDANQHFIGGMRNARVYWGMYGRDSLYLLGRAFGLPKADSALVVMVDHADSIGGQPTIVGVAQVDARLPPSFWGTTWMSADTLFHVQGRPSELRRALQESPLVRRFLELHGAP
jgi:hypothetical protein